MGEAVTNDGKQLAAIFTVASPHRCMFCTPPNTGAVFFVEGRQKSYACAEHLALAVKEVSAVPVLVQSGT